jgi:hypothetical protein
MIPRQGRVNRRALAAQRGTVGGAGAMRARERRRRHGGRTLDAAANA